MEDVIFADSPLASYLEGEGKNESNWIRPESADNEPNSKDASGFAPRGRPTFLTKLPTSVQQPIRLLDLRQSYFSSLQRVISEFVISQFGCNDGTQFVEHFRYLLVASQLLDECSGQTNPSNVVTLKAAGANRKIVHNYAIVSASFEGTIICTIIALVLVWLLRRFRDYVSHNGASSSLIMVLLLCAVVAFIGWTYIRTRLICRVRQRTIDVASAFVANLRAFEVSCSSALTYIQEIDLVSRGYRISHPLPPITRLDDRSPIRRCTSVRQCLRLSFESIIPTFLIAYDSLHALVSNEDDFEKYLEVYEIIPADINEAKLGYDKDDFEDMDTLKVLRILSFRLTILRRAILCSLMTIPAEGTKFNLDKWNSVTEMMHNLGSATGEASERINQILTKEDQIDQALPANRVLTARQERLQTQIRKLGLLSQGLRSLQAKLKILRDDSDKAVGVTEEDSDEVDTGLASQYDSIGEDLRQLLHSWEAGKTSLVLGMGRQERRLSLSHGRSVSSSVRSSGVRSPVSSISGQTAVEDGSPTAALRALNGEAVKAMTKALGSNKVSKRSSLAISARPTSTTSSNDVSGNGSGASAGSSAASDEEIFEAIAMPRKRMSMTREERMTKVIEDQARQKMLRERRETTSNMMRELESVICLRQPSPHGRGDDGDRSEKRSTSMW